MISYCHTHHWSLPDFSVGLFYYLLKEAGVLDYRESKGQGSDIELKEE